MDTTQRELIMQRWNVIQHELLPELRAEGPLTPKLEKVVHILEWVRIEEFTGSSWCGVGRPPIERAWLANAFVAKSVLGLNTTVGLIERLTIDRVLRRICGFPLCKKLPSETTFSRAFDEFAQAGLGQRVHEAFIKAHLADELIGHISRDGTAIEARERPSRSAAGSGRSAPGGAALDAPEGRGPFRSGARQRQKRRYQRRNVAAPGAAKHVRPQRRRRSSANAGRRWHKCSTRSPRRVIAARSAMPKATRSAGTVTSCISTPPTVASPSRRCSRARRCTTAVLPSRYR
jgi:hypothetical protein